MRLSLCHRHQSLMIGRIAFSKSIKFHTQNVIFIFDSMPCFCVFPLLFSMKSSPIFLPPRSLPPRLGQILTSGSWNVTRRAALLSTELLRILAGSHLSSILAVCGSAGRGNTKIISSGRIVQTQEEESSLRHQLETQTLQYI